MMLESLAFAFAVACAALMGFAIQRVATCTVAAVYDLMVRRSAARLASLLRSRCRFRPSRSSCRPRLRFQPSLRRPIQWRSILPRRSTRPRSSNRTAATPARTRVAALFCP